jgi:hypothetical protein
MGDTSDVTVQLTCHIVEWTHKASFKLPAYNFHFGKWVYSECAAKSSQSKFSLQVTKLFLIFRNVGHLLRASTLLIKPQLYPLINQFLSQLEANHSLTET